MNKILLNFVAIIILINHNLNDAKPQLNISQSGDIKIISSNGLFLCDSMECPAGSRKCTVMKKTTDNLKLITRIRKCLDGNGKILKEEQITETNPFPNYDVSDYAEALNNGNNIIQCRNCNDTNFNGIFKQNLQLKQYENSMQNYQMNLQQSMEDYRKKLQNSILTNIQNMFSGRN